MTPDSGHTDTDSRRRALSLTATISALPTLPVYGRSLRRLQRGHSEELARFVEVQIVTFPETTVAAIRRDLQEELGFVAVWPSRSLSTRGVAPVPSSKRL
jgi:hypothetical protein